jgi:DegV family protein with EDD domain
LKVKELFLKIRELTGEHLFWAFFSGKREVLKRRKQLNKINVFPVPDGDTGTNLAMTLHTAFRGNPSGRPVSEVVRSMGRAVLEESRGNSGIIFAQFIHGFGEAVIDKSVLTIPDFSAAMRKAVEHAYRSIAQPVEGTILTVMRRWSNALHAMHDKTGDFVELCTRSLGEAQKALKETRHQLKVLREAGVVDAGAQGFVHFLEGMAHFMRHRKKQGEESLEEEEERLEAEHPHVMKEVGELPFRYCTEAFLEDMSLDPETFRSLASEFGDSLIIAGSRERLKFHIHTSRPADLFFRLRDQGTIRHPKVEDMQRQVDVQFHRRSSIALVTDSSCDLPQEIMDRFQIHMIPVTISFGESTFLDKRTLHPDHFYQMLDEETEFPKTSQPPVKAFKNLYAWLLDHYQAIISIHLSKALSGTWNAAHQAALSFSGKSIAVIDSRNLSTALGLIVMYAAESIEAGDSWEEIAESTMKLTDHADILVSVPTLRFMIRGGRVSPLKGYLANALNLKPIVSLDHRGASVLYGKAFSVRSNIRKIVKKIADIHERRGVNLYAIGHAHAPDAARDLEQRIIEATGKGAAYTMDISPVIGAHAGKGAVSVSTLSGL